MLKMTDVPRPNNVFWIVDSGVIKVIQSQPQREVLLGTETARLWELIDLEEHTVTDLINIMRDEGIEEGVVINTLNRLKAIELITSENFLWKE